MATKKKSSTDKIIKEIAEEILKLMDLTCEIKISYDKSTQVYLLDISAGEEAGLLIGKKGETIDAIQVVINMILRQKTGDWLRVVVNVADFREKEISRMKELAEQTAQRVRETGEQQNLYNLTPSQRRIVHMSLSEEKDIQTESVGEGLSRYLVVSKK